MQNLIYWALNGEQLAFENTSYATHGRSICTDLLAFALRVFRNCFCMWYFPETVHARSYKFPCSIKGCFSQFEPNKRFWVFGRSNGIRTVSYNSSEYNDCVCQAGVISNKVAFSFCTLFKTRPIAAKGGKPCIFRWVHVIFKTSLPLLNGSNFHDMHVGTWREIVEAKTSMSASTHSRLPFAWVSHCLRLEIGFLVESTWKQVVWNLFTYIWENVVVGIPLCLHLYWIWGAAILSIWECMDGTDGCIWLKFRIAHFAVSNSKTFIWHWFSRGVHDLPVLCPWRGGPRLLRPPVCGRLRDICGWLWFSCGGAQPVEGLIAIFWGFFANAGEVFILAGGRGLVAGLSFYGV